MLQLAVAVRWIAGPIIAELGPEIVIVHDGAIVAAMASAVAGKVCPSPSPSASTAGVPSLVSVAARSSPHPKNAVTAHVTTPQTCAKFILPPTLLQSSHQLIV
jgi:hypothetical protein